MGPRATARVALGELLASHQLAVARPLIVSRNPSFLQPRLLAVAAVLSNRVERLEPRAIRLSDHFPAHAAACLCLSCAKS